MCVICMHVCVYAHMTVYMCHGIHVEVIGNQFSPPNFATVSFCLSLLASVMLAGLQACLDPISASHPAIGVLAGPIDMCTSFL